MRITVHIPDEVAREAEEAAREEDSSVSAFFARAMESFLRTRRQRQAASRIDALVGCSSVTPDADQALEGLRRSSDRDVS